jgi:zinc protease
MQKKNHKETGQKTTGISGSHYKHGFLANGMEFFILERKPLPVCSVTMLYRIGSAGEKRGQTGMAHFLEHMMFKGTKNFPAGMVDFISLRLGGETNAMTSRDYTAYFHLLPAANWSDVLEMEKERMTEMRFAKDSFETEKSVVLEERSLYLDDPGELLYDMHYKHAFADKHPYHHPVIGHQKDLLHMQAFEMQAFYQIHYKPENACLMVIGNVDISEVEKKITQCFQSPEAPHIHHPKIQPPACRDKKLRMPWHKIIKKDIECMRLKISYPSSRFATGEDAAGRVLEELLAGARSSLLPELLVEKLELVEEIDATLNSQELGGRFFIDCEPQNPEDCPKILSAIENAIEKLCREPIPAGAFEAARTRTLTNLLFDEERLDELTFELMSWLSAGKPDCYFELPARINALTLTEMQNYCQKILQPSQLIATCACAPEMATELERIWS